MITLDFSVVITTKNRLRFLKRAVASVFENDILPTEIIIINDGGELFDCSLFQQNGKGRGITVISNEQSKGANFCRNLGVKRATNEIVFFLDDDDAFASNSFSSRLKYFENPEVGIAYTGIRIVSDVDLASVIRLVYPKNEDDYYNALLIKGNVIGSTSRVAIKKSWFIRAGMFDENLPCMQDYELWIRMAKISKVVSDNDATVFYTIHTCSDQISSKYQKYISTVDYIIDKHKNVISKKQLKSFKSILYLRIAISAHKHSYRVKNKYACISILLVPNIKAFILLIVPSAILSKFYKFV